MASLRDAEEKHTNNWLRIIAIFGFVLIIPSLFLLHGSPAEGYELSIYPATPLPAWIFLLLALCVGFFIIIHQAFAREKSNFWLIGMLLVIFAIFVILTIPPLRGYFAFGAGDRFAHIDIANNLIASGHLIEGNFYPITHTLLATISQICNISPVWISDYLQPFISVLFILSMYLLARVILPQRGQALLALAVSAILFYGVLHRSLIPHAVGMLTITWVFYFYIRDIRKQLWQNRLLLILLLAFHVYLYPPVSMAITVCFLVAEIVRWQSSKRLAGEVKSSIWLGPVLISFIIFFLWSSGFPVFGRAIISSWSWLHGEVVHLTWVTYTEEMLAPLGLFDLANLALRMYGENFALILLSLLAGALIVKRLLHREAEMQRPLLAVVFFAVFGAMSLALLMVLVRQSVGRFLSLNYAMWVTPLLAGFSLYELFHKKSRLRIAAITSILVILSLVSIFGLYTSPNINQPSPHHTHMHMATTKWVTDRAAEVYVVTTMGYSFDTTAPVALAAHETQREAGEYRTFACGHHTFGIPDHFGYLQHENLAASMAYSQERLIITKGYQEVSIERFLIITKGYQEVSMLLKRPGNKMYAVFGEDRFSESDFTSLELDPSLGKLYSNNEVNVWYVSRIK